MLRFLGRFGSVTLAAALAGGALAQQSTPPPESSAPAPAPSEKQPPVPVTPTPAKPPAAKPTPADDNAFPEAESEAAARQADAGQSADAKASGSAAAPDSPDNSGNDSPGEAGSSSHDKLAGDDLPSDTRSGFAKAGGGTNSASTVLDPKLAAEDLKVGEQYMQMGDYPGAYSRFKEACAVNPDNLDAVFYLAEAARKTAHLDESAQNYKLYLAVEPDGSKAKAARKALAQLQGK